MNDIGWLLLEAGCLLVVIRLILLVYNHGFDAAKERIKLENQQPLAGLKEFGFVAANDMHSAGKQIPELAKYLGRIDGYPIEVFIRCQPVSFWREQHFTVRVFFNPDSTGAVNSCGAAIKNKVQSNSFKWQDSVALHANYGERKMVIGRFSKPDSRRLFAAAQEIAIELRKLELNPDAAG